MKNSLKGERRIASSKRGIPGQKESSGVKEGE